MTTEKQKINLEDSASNFLKKAKEKFPQRFTYNMSTYRGVVPKITIICVKHGSFVQAPYQHLEAKEPCKKCKSEKQSEESQKKYKNKFHQKWATKYTYDWRSWVNSNTKNAD